MLERNRLASSFESLRILRETAFTKGIMHVHSPAVFGAMRLFRKLAGLKTVLHIHLDFSAEELMWAYREPPDLTIVCAEFMRDAVESARQASGHARGMLSVIRNSVDLARFSQRGKSLARRELGVEESVPLALIVANLAPHKGQITCIRAIAELKRRGCIVRLWVVGECRDGGGKFEAELRALCEELGVEELVKFAGFRADTEILFRAADFALLPSTSEGLPLSILEAQASGAVVLAAPTAGIPEVIVENETGFLVPADDPVGYADRIQRMTGEHSQLLRIRESARRYVEREHDLDEFCKRVVLEYQKVLGGE
jgi:glycosyltransferase involved in cell wall biosynthesis